jgi:hypothetical protein
LGFAKKPCRSAQFRQAAFIPLQKKPRIAFRQINKATGNRLRQQLMLQAPLPRWVFPCGPLGMSTGGR